MVDYFGSKGYKNLYIDGGKTIQNFLKEDLIDDMIIMTLPIVLSGGKSLFGELTNSKEFKLTHTKVISNIGVQNHYHSKLD
ncbi:MAG: dihydrofolate reductase [Sulfurimonas sp.]|jgi:dihydrofolate reductase|uniref:dihydrofolate reductase family protein n=1 Tax=Sulfurimonas sp. TaxID=2022749 RepID=UPI0039E5952C